jgi:hypothetical protein
MVDLKWRKISTAPRDGTPILSYSPDGECFSEKFVEVQWLKANDLRKESGTKKGDYRYWDYVSGFYSGVDLSEIESELTHWMSLEHAEKWFAPAS